MDGEGESEDQEKAVGGESAPGKGQLPEEASVGKTAGGKEAMGDIDLTRETPMFGGG